MCMNNEHEPLCMPAYMWILTTIHYNTEETHGEAERILQVGQETSDFLLHVCF